MRWAVAALALERYSIDALGAAKVAASPESAKTKTAGETSGDVPAVVDPDAGKASEAAELSRSEAGCESAEEAQAKLDKFMEAADPQSTWRSFAEKPADWMKAWYSLAHRAASCKRQSSTGDAKPLTSDSPDEALKSWEPVKVSAANTPGHALVGEYLVSTETPERREPAEGSPWVGVCCLKAFKFKKEATKVEETCPAGGFIAPFGVHHPDGFKVWKGDFVKRILKPELLKDEVVAGPKAGKKEEVPPGTDPAAVKAAVPEELAPFTVAETCSAAELAAAATQGYTAPDVAKEKPGNMSDEEWSKEVSTAAIEAKEKLPAAICSLDQHREVWAVVHYGGDVLDVVGAPDLATTLGGALAVNGGETAAPTSGGFLVVAFRCGPSANPQITAAGGEDGCAAYGVSVFPAQQDQVKEQKDGTVHVSVPLAPSATGGATATFVFGTPKALSYLGCVALWLLA